MPFARIKNHQILLKKISFIICTFAIWLEQIFQTRMLDYFKWKIVTYYHLLQSSERILLQKLEKLFYNEPNSCQSNTSEVLRSHKYFYAQQSDNILNFRANVLVPLSTYNCYFSYQRYEEWSSEKINKHFLMW